MYYSAKTSRYRQNRLSYVPKKILTWMLREARGSLKATVGNRVLPDYHFIHIVFVLSVSFSQSLVFPSRLCSEAFQHILDIMGLSQADVRRTYLNLFDSDCYSFMKRNLRIIRNIKTLKVLLATTIWPTTQEIKTAEKNLVRVSTRAHL